MVEGKDRIRVEWLNGHGQQQAQVFTNTKRVLIEGNMFFLYIHNESKTEEQVILGIPVERLVRFAALKDSKEEVDESSESRESPEDSQVRNSTDA